MTFALRLAGSVLVPLLLSPLARADDIIYSYCQLGSDRSTLPAGRIVLLSFNLRTAEEALYVQDESRQFTWLAGRRPEREAGFEVQGDMQELDLARALRNSVSGQRFHRIRSVPDANRFAVDAPGECQLD